ncbi:ABC transporter permease [Pseudonocardia alaniniphila]|uniref:ABC transporter permease n=1 Tax=Pseudonocardia alaniniphila TaxID=75291 RepID=A0ABS9TK36_9PSEU|nr:ABC transporter permease [Pseudonocardia alaniniphila]MCH6168905.1 ABC transporter permease [Pseudonocardia alaniniphila]
MPETTTPGMTPDTSPGDAVATQVPIATMAAKGKAKRIQRANRAPVGWYIAWAWLGAVVLSAVFAPLLPLWDPAVPDYNNVFGGITPQHWLGGDTLGRDNLSRIIYGARASLLVGICAVLLGALVGGILGMMAGYFGGRTERVLALVTDVVLAFPGLVFIIALVAILGSSLTNLIIGLAILSVPTFIRLSRAATLTVAQREFVQAARAYGSKPLRIIAREIAPNVVLPVAAYGFIMIGVFIVVEGSLSFLGLGIPPPTPSWGGMIAGGRTELLNFPHISLFPAAVMFLTVLSINYIGERTRKQFEVKESNL